MCVCLFVCFSFLCGLSWSPAPCQAVCFSLASAQSWLLSFWSPSIPDVGKTSVLSSCLVLADDSQAAAAVPCSCMGFHCMHRARPSQDQKTHRGSSSLQNHPLSPSHLPPFASSSEKADVWLRVWEGLCSEQHCHRSGFRLRRSALSNEEWIKSSRRVRGSLKV